MLHDEPRTLAYRKAIEGAKNFIEGKVCNSTTSEMLEMNCAHRHNNQGHHLWQETMVLEQLEAGLFLLQLVSAPLQQAWDTLNFSLYWNYC
jgi:hypothetical protein